MLAIYGPYLAIFGLAEWSWFLVAVWPIFPGLVTAELAQPYFHSEWLRGAGGVLLLTAVILAVSIFGALRLKKRALFAMMMAVGVLSLTLVQGFYALLRA